MTSITTVGVGVALAGRRLANWGATAVERAAVLPGDELIPEPARQATLGVTIDAPMATVWKWLVQIGQERGGLYSYDLVENAIGLNIHSATEIRDEWQSLAVGDRVTLVRAGWPLFPKGYSLPVERIEPEHLLLLRQLPTESPWDSIWAFHLIPDGIGRSRLLSRSRTAVPFTRLHRIGVAVSSLFDPVTYVMTRKMLLGIKKRAEGSRDPGGSAGGLSR